MTDQPVVIPGDAEATLLAIVLKHPEVVYELEGLKDFMFSSLPHQEIFCEIQEMIERQIPTDPTLLIDQLEAANKIRNVGGRKYIEHLVNRQVNRDTLSEYKRLVINSYKARSVISLGNSISTTEKVNVDNVDDKIVEIKKGLDTLVEVRGGTQTIHVGDSVKGVYEDILSGLSKAGLRGASWGVKDLDAATGGKCPGELMIIGGRPGAGKSALLFNSILQDGRNGIPVLLFEREMRVNEVVERLVSLDTRIPITNIRLRILNKTQIEQIHESLGRIKSLPIYIDTSYRSSDIYYLESTVAKYRSLKGIEVVYVDYLQKIVERDDNQVNAIGRITGLFKTLSNEMNICSVIASQLNRSVEQRDNKRPILPDLRQSGNIEEDADIVVGLYREDYYHPETKNKGLMEFIVLKYRNGPPGTVTVKFEDVTNIISNTGG